MMTLPAEMKGATLNHLLRNLHDALGAATAALAHRLQLSATDAAAVEHISLSDKPVGPGELAARLAITRSSATEVVDRLVAAGHVERVRDETDRRRFRLEPTESARTRVREELGPLVEVIAAAAEPFSPAEHEVIEKYLNAVTSAYYAYAEASDPTAQGPRGRS